MSTTDNLVCYVTIGNIAQFRDVLQNQLGEIKETIPDVRCRYASLHFYPATTTRQSTFCVSCFGIPAIRSYVSDIKYYWLHPEYDQLHPSDAINLIELLSYLERDIDNETCTISVTYNLDWDGTIIYSSGQYINNL